MGLRPRFKTPFSQARDRFVNYFTGPFMSLRPRTRFLVGAAVLVIATTLLLWNSSSSTITQNYKEGEVLTRAIVVPADITTIDLVETERRKAAARELSRPIFNFDSSRAETSVQGFRSDWEELKKQVNSGQAKNAVWSGDGGPGVGRAIIAHNFDEDDLDRLTSLLREIGSGYIYDDSEVDRLGQDIVLVDIRNPVAQMIIPAPRTRMIALSAARRNLEIRVLNLPDWSADEKLQLVSALSPLVRPNVVLDETATAAARENEANNVPVVVI
ncbi:MAG TPA: hypothetical protein VIR01_18265, partial [Pyrinomonadaceae bacterium]